MKRINKNTQMGMSLGICYGVAIGTSIEQLLFDNISIGMCIGMCFGMLSGGAIGSIKDKAINKQIEEVGYKVKKIIKNEDEKTYCVIIESKAGEEKNITISFYNMKEEKFVVGDVVYLDENNTIEKVFDKEEE